MTADHDSDARHTNPDLMVMVVSSGMMVVMVMMVMMMVVVVMGHRVAAAWLRWCSTSERWASVEVPCPVRVP
jgi:hypothetical protein